MQTTAGPKSQGSAAVIDELARQHHILKREVGLRLMLTWVAFALSAVYLNSTLMFGLALVDTAAELFSVRIMAGLDPARDRLRYRVTVLCVVLMEGSYSLAAGMVWQMDDPFAKAFAVGMIMTTLLQLTTVRSIHLPYGATGLATVGAFALGANFLLWFSVGSWTGLFLSSVAACGGLAYSAVAMRSNHALHRQSADGQAKARAANDAKGRLLAQISHELRTPLNGILGMGHAELGRAATPEARARLAVLVRSAEDLSIILDDILDISAAQEGKLAIRMARAVPADEIAATIQLFRHGIADGTSPITLRIAPALSRPAIFDRQRLRQCLSNLISNALRHGLGAPVRLTAELIEGPEGQALLELIVADDGPGIADARRALLFEPFASFGSTGSQHAPGRSGHGLGLSIARSLARQMGGDITLFPAGVAGAGATFRMTIAVMPTTGPAAVARVDHDATPALAGLHVLVVDDIATNRLVASSCLGLVGVIASEADSGVAALRCLAGGEIDVVLLDLNMPGLDGRTTLDRIRGLPGSAGRVPVIAMTADTGDHPDQRYRAAGFDGYLSKPITPERLEAGLRAVMRPEKAAQQPRPLA